jgi:DNA-binding MarR family transcriptional regulator
LAVAAGGSCDDDGRTACRPYPTRLADNAAFLLARLGQETVRPFAHALAPSGLAPREWGLLEVLSDGGPGTQAELCARLRLDRADMTRFVERLEERGLVTSRPDPADRRAKQVAITGSGRAALRRARPLAAEAERLALPGLDDDERAELRRLLATVAAHRGAGAGRRQSPALDPRPRTSDKERP